MKKEFSVLMSVYYKENPEYLKLALDSIINQTLVPNEIVLVEDGSLTDELNFLIKKYQKKYKILKVIKLEKNSGLGIALSEGLKHCSYEYVARMDSDDISLPDRFEKQINYMTEHPEIDVLGGNIYEFKNNIDEEMRLKKMPANDEFFSYMLKRNPINHVTSCFKKDAVLECGSYQSLLYLEDYYLWVRMFNNGKKFENLDEVLVYVRIGNGFEKRRGNKKQIVGWKCLQQYMLDNKMITKKRYFCNMLNIYLLCYCPTTIRKIAYKFILRAN